MHAGRDARGSNKRRSWDALILAVNVTIVIVGVAVVWSKLRERAGLGERETPALDTSTIPLPPSRLGLGAALDQPPQGADDHVTAADAPVQEPDVSVVEEEPTERQPVTDIVRLRGRTDASVAPASLPDLEPSPPITGLEDLAGTESVIDRLGVELELLHTIRGAYPTSAAEFGTNRGIEALHAALAKVGKTAALRLGDTDEDGRMEILDAWGRPLIFLSPDDYDATQRWAGGDAASVEIAACRSDATHAVLAAATYQLWSVGADGRPNGGHGDDVTSWVRRD